MKVTIDLRQNNDTVQNPIEVYHFIILMIYLDSTALQKNKGQKEACKQSQK